MEASERVERMRYRFIGHVQHRGFRYACVTCARKEHMTGWVRNERNGIVTAEAQGTPQAHLAFIRRLSALVPGFGNDWSVGTEKSIAIRDDETDFGVHRY